MTEINSKLEQFIVTQALLPQFSYAAITGDASFRRYWRIKTKQQTYILMYSDPAVISPVPFIELTNAFLKAGLNVPTILAKDEQQGFVLLEDLGSVHLAERLGLPSKMQDYQALIDLLPKIALLPAHPQMKPYDDAFVEMELNIFTTWLVQSYLGINLTADYQAKWTSLVSWLVSEFAKLPKVTMHRDFHSRNVMFYQNQWVLIDYQDAVQGPVTYDLVSLLRDCYYRLDEHEYQALLGYGYHTLAQANLLEGMDYETFSRAIDITGLQRHLKAAGIFCRLKQRDGKAGYIANVVPTLQYIVDVAKLYPQSQWLSDWIEADILPALKKRQDTSL
jgi:hypothetical protein